MMVLITIPLCSCSIRQYSYNFASDNPSSTSNESLNEKQHTIENPLSSDDTHKKSVKNVTSQNFQLSEGFIVPIDVQSTVPDGWIGIYTVEEFVKISLNGANKYILMNDLDLTSLSKWTVVSINEGGIFDGNGYTITCTDIPNTALFQQIAKRGTIRNLHAELNGSPVVDHINDSIIDNCHTSGVVNINYYLPYNSEENELCTLPTSAIAKQAENKVSILNCYNTAIFVEDKNNLIDSSYGDLSKSYLSIGNVRENKEIGPIVALASDIKIINCNNQQNIIIEHEGLEYKGSTYTVGGIVGKAENIDIINCYNSGNISINYICYSRTPGGDNLVLSTCCIAGGLIGSSGGAVIENSYNSGDIITQGHSCGIVNISYGYHKISNCYNSGTILSNNNRNLYGIAGSIESFDKDIDIMYSYNLGKIDNSDDLSEKLGEFIGDIDGKIGGITMDSAQLDYCYFLDDVEEATPRGTLFAHVKKLTDSQMKDQSSFVGFDFDNVWEMGSSNYPYPVFAAVYE